MMAAALRGNGIDLDNMFSDYIPDKDNVLVFADDLDAQRSTLGAPQQAPFNMDFLSLAKDTSPKSKMPWDTVGSNAEKETAFSFASTESPTSFSNLESFGSSIPSPGSSFINEPLAPPPGLLSSVNMELKVPQVPEVPPPPLAPAATAGCLGCCQDHANPATSEDDGSLPSVGSALHAAGECTPCKFFRGRRGCKDGDQCKLCHFPHNELTYSGIRRMMRKKGLEKHSAFDAEDCNVADVPAAPVRPLSLVPPPPQSAPNFPTSLFKPPPGLEHPSLSPAFLSLGSVSASAPTKLSFSF